RHHTTINNWISAHSSLLQSGDIFTPMEEPDAGGIAGFDYCGQNGICQFNSKSDFNSWLRTTYSDAVSRVPAGVNVGYWGFDGFTTAGLNNVDHQGQSELEAATISQQGEVAIDN